MKSEHLPVVILQDNKGWMDRFLSSLGEAGIEVYKKATNMAEALQILEELREAKQLGELRQFALALDMNLEEGEYDGDDGYELLPKFEEILPSLIAFSISSYQYPNLPDLHFVGQDPAKLVEGIKKFSV